jgi:hypothetical protein
MTNLTLVDERDAISEARASRSQTLESLGLSVSDDSHSLNVARRRQQLTCA